MSATKYLRICGRVQGVGFRFYMRRKAAALALTGWVRNRRDGSVDAVVQGAPEAVETMIAWARHGPPSAKVTGITVEDAEGSYAEFSTLPTD